MLNNTHKKKTIFACVKNIQIISNSQFRIVPNRILKMVKCIVSSGLCLSLALVSCEAQLSNVPKRYRENIIVDEQKRNTDGARKLSINEFGRRAYKVDKIERQLAVEGESSMSFPIRKLEEMSMSIDYFMSIADVEAPEEVEAAESSATHAGVSVLALLPVAWFML
mmetsp:Transcript_6184/g.12442  ORF Transcript_6184/g.12442 Transcript_6184/m.12442 type:complete len:166 (+) Transcript_6184:3-500(+)